MWNCLLRWFSRPPQAEPPSSDDQVLTLERELQSLRLELEERNRTLAKLKRDLEHHRDAQDARLTATVQAQLEQLLTDVAAPVTQLLTQAHLLEVDGRPIQAQDVLAIAKRLVRTLQDHGLVLEESVGQTIPLDPNRHEPLSADVRLTSGEKVIVKSVGVSYQGKVIKKAGVAKS